MVRLPEDEEYVEETGTGDERLRDSQPTQIAKRAKSHRHKAPDEEAENAHSRRLPRDAQTAQRSAAIAENIVHSRHLLREDQTGRRSAAAIKKSSPVPRAAPVPAAAPPIVSLVTRSQGKVST